MSILNTAICTTGGGNTGIPDCAFDPQNLKGGFLVPNSFVLTEEQLASAATVLAALQLAVNNDNPSLRIYPLPETVGFTDNSEDAVSQTLGYGSAVIVRDGKYNLTQQYTKGGLCISKTLQRFNGGNMRWLGIDAAGVLIGTKVGNTLKGVPLDQFYAPPFKWNDGANITAYTYRLAFDPIHVNQNIAFVPMNYADLVNINGIQNIVISSAAARVAAVMKVRLTSGCAGIDMYDTYSAELADADLFLVTQAGKSITVTSVAVDANLKAFTITVDAADPDYNAAGPFVVNLAPISVLTAAGVVGFEGVPATIA
jgi:hypothetical protein